MKNNYYWIYDPMYWRNEPEEYWQQIGAVVKEPKIETYLERNGSGIFKSEVTGPKFNKEPEPNKIGFAF